MRNVLSKALICGVLASTIIMVNCQKAPSRGVRAGTDGGNQATTNVAPKIGVCTEEIIEQLQARKAAVTALTAAIAAANASISSSESATPTAAGAEAACEVKVVESVKQDLLSKAADLYSTTRAVAASIRAISVNNAPADGCKGSDIANAESSTEVEYKIQEMIVENLRLGQATRGLVCQATDLEQPLEGEARTGTPEEGGEPPSEETPAPPSDEATPPPAEETPAPAPANPESSAQPLEAAQVLVVSADLAGVLARTTADSNKYLVSGEIKTGDNQQQTRDTANSTNTLCKISTSGGELNANDELKVEAIDSDDADGGLKVASVMLNTIPAAPEAGAEATPPKTYILSCNVARGVDPAKGVRASLGDLVTINAPAAATPPPADAPAPPPAEPPAPTTP